MPRAKVGPLDIITGIAGAAFAGYGYACYKGYVIPATAIFGSLIGVMYILAPARYYPTSEAVTKDIDLKGKVALVTGSTSGIGVETARVLALRGAHVYLAARNTTKLKTTQKQLEAELPDKCQISILQCDLGNLESVKECATQFLAQEKKLDIQVNNAGIMAIPERRSTVQGLEQQVGVCHVGHFYLTKLLMPALSKTQSRIVCLSSVGWKSHDFKACLNAKDMDTIPYDAWTAYGNAKIANLLHAKGLADRGYQAFSVMPGGIHTGLQNNVSWWMAFKWAVVTPFFFKSIQQGAATTLVCATKATEVGEYFENCKANKKVLMSALNQAGKDAADRCWNKTEEVLQQLKFD